MKSLPISASFPISPSVSSIFQVLGNTACSYPRAFVQAAPAAWDALPQDSSDVTLPRRGSPDDASFPWSRALTAPWHICVNHTMGSLAMLQEDGHIAQR